MDIQTDCLPQRPDTLLVLLPGAHVVPADFWHYGFVDAVRSRRFAVDIVSANVDYLHVMARTVVSALQAEVIEPALAQGYRSIWFAGISLGGLNSLLYAAHHGDLLAGIHLLSPYPGTRDIWLEIHAAGGLQAWRDSAAADLGEERDAWRWLVDQARAAYPVKVSFGCGEQDRFITTQRMFTDILPAERVHLIPGTHDWPTWQALWQLWLETSPWPRQPEESVS